MVRQVREKWAYLVGVIYGMLGGGIYRFGTLCAEVDAPDCDSFSLKYLQHGERTNRKILPTRGQTKAIPLITFQA